MELTCPKCQGDLRSYERSGVTVDQCTECRGIFLDRGELEKLVDAEKSWAGQQPAPQQGHEHQGYREDQHGEHRPRKKRKSSFFEELLG
jgi:Zn-finger nucleic acid-binding protein